jgi:hypothetical protein
MPLKLMEAIDPSATNFENLSVFSGTEFDVKKLAKL